MAALGKIGAYLKNAWAKEPVLVVSCALGILATTLPWISPYTKYSGMANRAVPYVYPVDKLVVCSTQWEATDASDIQNLL
ncbi:hypothetical protein JD844_001458 [Phrynosoma platyrhinos]|uniref:NADH dehydrogenase [ubiquinone] 1 alpha subcomplex subunit 3 n=1 Tax=Phrynosoma platyrhinos TaxID=52577 RepID=A0ABQ7TA99_PHRPL|nr:hypothetical protein JD844_001458 [Phrynosoma platyrhinos]